MPVLRETGTTEITLIVSDGFLSASNSFLLSVISLPTVTVSRTAEDLFIAFDTVAGKTYLIEYADTIDAATWNELRLVSGTGSQDLIDIGLMSATTRFFRIRCHD